MLVPSGLPSNMQVATSYANKTSATTGHLLFWPFAWTPKIWPRITARGERHNLTQPPPLKGQQGQQ
jgi:hypothetical protein